MFILSSISSILEFWSVNHTSLYGNSELKLFKRKTLKPKRFIGANVTKLLNLSDNHCWQCYNGLIPL